MHRNQKKMENPTPNLAEEPVPFQFQTIQEFSLTLIALIRFGETVKEKWNLDSEITQMTLRDVNFMIGKMRKVFELYDKDGKLSKTEAKT